MYWEPDKECLDPEELEQIQIERLQSTLTRVYQHVPFYRKKFTALGLSPEDVGSLADLARLPFTTKADLRENYPYGLFAVPMREVVRIHASSGTTGLATVVGYTRNDIRTWSNLVARIITMGAGAALCFLSLAVVLVAAIAAARVRLGVIVRIWVDADKLNEKGMTVTDVIAQATPVVTWVAPDAIVYGAAGTVTGNAMIRLSGGTSTSRTPSAPAFRASR